MVSAAPHRLCHHKWLLDYISVVTPLSTISMNSDRMGIFDVLQSMWWPHCTAEPLCEGRGQSCELADFFGDKAVDRAVDSR